MDKFMMVLGSKIYFMEKDSINGLMEIIILEAIRRVKEMDLE